MLIAVWEHPATQGDGIPVTTRKIRQRCARLAGQIDVPDPFDLDEFIADVGARRGRPIVLMPFDLPTGAPCGLCVSTDTADYVVVTSAATGTQRVHIALHELSHLLLGHSLHVLPDTTGSRHLFRHLDPAVVRAMFARTNYSTEQEREAEILASLLGQRTGLWRTPARRAAPGTDARPQASDPLVERIGQALEHRNR